jgi:hypothetical protein
MSLLKLSFSHARVMLEIVSSCINCVNYFPSLIKFVCLRTLQGNKRRMRMPSLIMHGYFSKQEIKRAIMVLVLGMKNPRGVWDWVRW